MSSDQMFAAGTLLFILAIIGLLWLLRAELRRSRRVEPTKVTRVTVTTDGPIQPEDLQAIGHLLTAHFEDPDAVFQAILDQVAKDEAAVGLDTALDRITGDGAR